MRKLLPLLFPAEPRLFAALGRWIARRPDHRGGTAFDYPRTDTMLFWTIVVLCVVEGGAVEFVLALLRVPIGWEVASIVLHVYAVFWILGMMASFAVKPHLLTGDAIVVRDGVSTELRFGYDTVRAAVVERKRSEGFGGRTGLKVGKDGVALLAYGDATVRIDFHPDALISRNGQPLPSPYKSLRISVADAARFVRTIHSRLPTMAAS
ncbi:hypothetical protein [Fodinicola feengrottensis]|uniref:PH domain-containing protein n=1 Tax=Fodinicola feengrottensis TaxID=435914 RepID=A0ABN2H4J4_9ACTN|nr:hypothetical protein [Fodinicola feengrottensis]